MSMTELVNRCVDAAIAVPDHDELGPDYNAIVRAVLAEAGVQDLVEALDFYAANHDWPNEGPWGVDSTDFGDVARAALVKIGATQ